MTSLKIQVRGIFNTAGELVRILYPTGNGSTFYDVELSKDASIDEFFLEMCPPLQKSNETKEI